MPHVLWSVSGPLFRNWWCSFTSPHYHRIYISHSVCVCVTKWCERCGVKDGGWQSAVWKMVCERWCVTKLGVKDGVWKVVCERWCVTKMVRERGCVKDGAWKMACDKVVCHRWRVKKLCVKDGVSKMVGDKVVCERWCVTEGGCHQVPHLPRKTKVDVSKCHVCHAKWRSMSPQVPRLPRKEPRRPRRQLRTRCATRARPVP